MNVREVSGMLAGRIARSMRPVARIEMRTRGREVRLTPADRVDMNAVRARRQSGQVGREKHTGRRLLQCGLPDRPAADIVKLHARRGRGGKISRGLPPAT